jgi:anti-anti-sigma factor
MLKVHTERLGRIAVLRLRGSVVVGREVQKLRRAVLAQSDSRVVVLDLKYVTTNDAAGLGLLLELHAEIHSTARKFRLININTLVRQLFEITCLDAVFEISAPEEVELANAGEALTEGNSKSPSRLAADLTRFFRTDPEGETL